MDQSVDWAAEAAKFGGSAAPPAAPAPTAPAGGTDWAAEAAKFGGSAQPPGPYGQAPTWKDDVADSAKFLGNEALGVLGAPISAAKSIYDMGARALSGQNPVQPIIDSSVSNFKKAQADTDPYAKAAHYLGAIPLSPIGGMYDKFQAGDMSGLANDIGDTAGQIALGKAVPEIPGAVKKTANAVREIPNLPGRLLDTAMGVNKLAPEQLITKGLRGSVPQGRTNFYSNLSNSMPAIKAVEAAFGKPIESLDDLVGTPEKPGAIAMAKRANRAEYNQLLSPQQAMNAQIRLDPVADAIENSISHKTKLENPGEAARIQAVADKYRQPFSVDTVDSLLRSTNAELNAYYGKNPAARRVASAANPDTALLDAQGQALRNALYENLDAPQGGAAARQLQREYGALSELQDAMEKRKNVAIRQAPDSLSENLAKWSSLGDAIQGAGKILTSPLSENPVGKFASGATDIVTGLGKTRLAKWIKEQQGTDALIKRAFANHTTPRMPVNFPPPIQPAGLLGPGPIVTPPPADTSGPVTNAGPRMGMGISPNARAPTQRLLGPATGGPMLGPSGSPIITPAPEGSYPVSGPMAPQYPVGSGNNRLLGHPQSIPGNPGPFGMSMGDDLVPVTHPQTGHVEYVPKWMTQNAGGEATGAAPRPKVADGTVVRSKSNPSVRMVYKAGEWHPH